MNRLTDENRWKTDDNQARTRLRDGYETIDDDGEDKSWTLAQSPDTTSPGHCVSCNFLYKRMKMWWHIINQTLKSWTNWQARANLNTDLDMETVKEDFAHSCIYMTSIKTTEIVSL